MASEKLTQLIDEISSLTVLELSELVKELEEKFGVSAAAPVMAVAPGAGAGAGADAAEEEKTSFTVILKSPGANKINVIKRCCYGILNVDHLFQRIFLDIRGYSLFAS